MNVRFVAVASMRRGVINPPELLDEDGQVMAALSLAREGAPRLDARVVWRRDDLRKLFAEPKPALPRSKERGPRVRRMLELAGRRA